MDVPRNQNSKMHPDCQLVGMSADALSVIQHTADLQFSITHMAGLAKEEIFYTGAMPKLP